MDHHDQRPGVAGGGIVNLDAIVVGVMMRDLGVLGMDCPSGRECDHKNSSQTVMGIGIHEKGRLEGDENSVKAFGFSWTMISNQPVGQAPFISLQLSCGVLPGGSISLDSQSIVISESDSSLTSLFILGRTASSLSPVDCIVSTRA